MKGTENECEMSEREGIPGRELPEIATSNAQPQLVVRVTEPHKLVYRVREAAPMLSVSVNELRRMIHEGEIGFIKSEGGTFRVPLAAINRWIAEHITEPRS